MNETTILAMTGTVAAAAAIERSIARRFGVRVRTLRALGLTFADRASADRWLIEAPAEALLALRASEIGVPIPMPGRAA